MSKNERFDKILEILDCEDYVSAQKLSKLLFVSLPTIRRDLAILEKDGMIIRNHGGAHKISEGKYEIPFNFRSSYKQAEKKALCKVAAGLIKDNMTIYIDGSSTASYIINYLEPNKNITVITNGIKNCFLFSSKGIKVIGVGGEVVGSSNVFAGEIALQTIKNFNIDIMFISSYGIKDNYVSETNLAETILKREVANLSSKKVYLCDEEKIGIAAKYNIMQINSFDYIITNGDLPQNGKTKIIKV